MGILEITTTQSLGILQNWYRKQYNDQKYIVVMFRHKKISTSADDLYSLIANLDRILIATSVDELYTKVMNQFQIEEHAKKDMKEGLLRKVELGYFQWSGQMNSELVSGEYIPDIFFASPDDTKSFMELVRPEMNDIFEHYKRKYHHD